MKEYIITETDVPTSYDPLDADQTQNLPVARMIYHTPLEIDASDTITSQVLESFNYDKKTKTIRWVVKKNLKYNDETPISTDDVVLSVKRMLLTRPQFPVIESIEGKDQWLKEENPLNKLPSGVKVIGNEISITLTRDYPHPLFRFCLELFSIIPKKCIDLKSGKITCERPPESGRYVIVKKSDKSILFSNRGSKNNQILFKYIPAVELVKLLPKLSSESVVAGNESMFSRDELAAFRKLDSFYYLPASRFSVLQLNPDIAPFDDKLCRLYFAKQFRNEYEKLTKDYSPAESSIFTKIIAGYLPRRELESVEFKKIKNSDFESCLDRLRKKEIAWAYVENEINSAFVTALKNTFTELNLRNSPIVVKSRKELAEKFINGEIAIFNGASGFWANDPLGDLKMLFTPNLHKPLNYISRDKQLQNLIEECIKNPSNKENLNKVNQYLHDQGLFNVYTHVRRFYFSKDSKKLKQIPQGSAAPNPWQVLE
ncbi:MAG: hypothetical protein JNL11_10905 [Bdellovibrionaceae bacterium]|nr:hypothetical protein [Pseudobdellovibrionaceae bacterium]